MTPPLLTRRRLIAGGAAFGGLLLAGCDRLSASPTFRDLLARAEPVTMASQRGLLAGGQLAREVKPSDISPLFRANGSVDVADPAYRRMAQSGFSDYALSVTGMVARPLRLSLETLRGGVQRTQITRHDCVEGWSAIGKWGGVRFSDFLRRVGADLGAKYVDFRCADDYHTSIDMATALHPQTTLALSYDGQVLPAKYGYPVKLRMPTKLGYKNPKHIRAIVVTNTYPGGYWEDQGYNWFGGS